MKEVVNVSDVCLKYQSKNGEIEALSHFSFSINSMRICEHPLAQADVENLRFFPLSTGF